MLISLAPLSVLCDKKKIPAGLVACSHYFCAELDRGQRVATEVEFFFYRSVPRNDEIPKLSPVVMKHGKTNEKGKREPGWLVWGACLPACDLAGWRVRFLSPPGHETLPSTGASANAGYNVYNAMNGRRMEIK